MPRRLLLPPPVTLPTTPVLCEVSPGRGKAWGCSLCGLHSPRVHLPQESAPSPWLSTLSGPQKEFEAEVPPNTCETWVLAFWGPEKMGNTGSDGEI